MPETLFLELFVKLYVKKTVALGQQMVYHDRVYIFIQLMYNKNDYLAKQSIFCQMFVVFFGFYNPSPPPDPRRSVHMLYMFIATWHCPKGILGLRGGGHLKTN